MKLSPEIIKESERIALGLVLSDWGNLTYEEVLESLGKDEQDYPSHKEIVVWQPHEDKWAEFILEEIENNYARLIQFAKFVKESTPEPATKYTLHKEKLWVADDGSWGQCDILIADVGKWTGEQVDAFDDIANNTDPSIVEVINILMDTKEVD